jgi:hypothetical protein
MYGGRERDVRCCCCKPPHARPHERYADTCTVGYAGRDLYESMLNYGLVNHHCHRRRRLVKSRARPRSSRGGGERNHLAAGVRYIAVIDIVAYKMCCILILVHLEYPPPVIRQLNRRIILAIVRGRCLICGGGQKNCVVRLYMVDMRQAGVQGYNWNKLVPVVLKILAETDASLERFCYCWR